jgi:hypothetical protein
MPSLACAVVALISTVFITMVAADSSSATICPGYVLETDPTPTTSGTGIEAELTLHRHRVGNARCAALGPDYDRLKFEAVYDTPERLHLTIADFEGLRWRVPQSIVPRPGPQMPPSNCLSRYQLSVSKHNEPFGFSISRSSSSAGSNANQMALFSTVGLNLVFKEQYMEVSTHLPLNANIYGLGETTRPNFRLNPNNTRATIWTRGKNSTTHTRLDW